MAKYTLAQAVPHLVRLFLNPDEAPNRGPTLRLLSDIINAARDSMQVDDAETLPADEDIPLLPYKDEVLGVLTVGLTAPATCRHALDGLKGLVTTRGLLTSEEIGFTVHKVNELLSGEDEDVKYAPFSTPPLSGADALV